MTVPWNDPWVGSGGAFVTGLLSFVAPGTRPASGVVSGPVAAVSPPPHATVIQMTATAHAIVQRPT